MCTAELLLVFTSTLSLGCGLDLVVYGMGLLTGVCFRVCALGLCSGLIWFLVVFCEWCFCFVGGVVGFWVWVAWGLGCGDWWFRFGLLWLVVLLVVGVCWFYCRLCGCIDGWLLVWWVGFIVICEFMVLWVCGIEFLCGFE